VGLVEYSSCGLAILTLDVSLGIKISVTVINSSFRDRSIHWSMEKGTVTTLYLNNYEKIFIFTRSVNWWNITVVACFIYSLFCTKKLRLKVVHKICENCFSEY
jgi:hypothetical protein